MIRIEMADGTRNYLIRILKKYKTALDKTNKVSDAYKKYEREQIDDAMSSLLGKRLKVELDRKNPYDRG